MVWYQQATPPLIALGQNSLKTKLVVCNWIQSFIYSLTNPSQCHKALDHLDDLQILSVDEFVPLEKEANSVSYFCNVWYYQQSTNVLLLKFYQDTLILIVLSSIPFYQQELNILLVFMTIIFLTFIVSINILYFYSKHFWANCHVDKVPFLFWTARKQWKLVWKQVIPTSPVAKLSFLASYHLHQAKCWWLTNDLLLNGPLLQLMNIYLLLLMVFKR